MQPGNSVCLPSTVPYSPVNTPIGFIEFVVQPNAVDFAKGTLRRVLQARCVLVPLAFELLQLRIEEALTILGQLVIFVAARHGPLDEALRLLHAGVDARHALLSTLLQRFDLYWMYLSQ